MNTGFTNRRFFNDKIRSELDLKQAADFLSVEYWAWSTDSQSSLLYFERIFLALKKSQRLILTVRVFLVTKRLCPGLQNITHCGTSSPFTVASINPYFWYNPCHTSSFFDSFCVNTIGLFTKLLKMPSDQGCSGAETRGNGVPSSHTFLGVAMRSHTSSIFSFVGQWNGLVYSCIFVTQITK